MKLYCYGQLSENEQEIFLVNEWGWVGLVVCKNKSPKHGDRKIHFYCWVVFFFKCWHQIG